MSSLKKQFVSGVIYTAAAKYAGLVVQVLITGILARLLKPEDFGVVAIATVFIVFFNLLSDFGIGTAVIQNKTLERKDISNIFSLSIYVGVGLALMFFLIAPLIARVYHRPTLENICRCLSLNILFASFNVVPNALLLREKQFKFIAARTFIIQVIGGVLGIGAAFLGFGVYSLLVHAISSSLFLFIVNYCKNPLKISLRFKLEPLKKIFSYSVYQFFFNFVNYFSRNLDTLLIGRFLSPALLGYYDKAYRLMLLPIENLTHVLSPVVHPFFSDFQADRQKMFGNYLKIVYLLAIIGFPLSAYLHFTAREVIFIIFGDQWEPAIPVFKILAWSVGVQIVLSSSGAIFQAANSTRPLFISGLLSSLLMILSICYGVFIAKSLTGTAYGLLTAFAINFMQCFGLLIKIVLKGSFRSFLAVFKTPLLLFLLIALCEYLYTSFIKTDGIIVNFVYKSLITGVAVVAGIVVLGDYKTIKSFFLSLKQR